MTNTLFKALEAVENGFDNNPGISDLDDEQPVWVRMSLGDWRRLSHEYYEYLDLDTL